MMIKQSTAALPKANHGCSAGHCHLVLGCDSKAPPMFAHIFSAETGLSV